MRELMNLVVGGTVAGGLYAVLAVGIVLTYRTSGVFNLAHGATAFAAAFLFFELNTGLGWPLPLAAAATLFGFAPAFGWVLDRFLFRGLADAPDTVRLVVPLALLVAVPSLCLLLVDRANAWLGTDLPTHDQVLAVPGLGPTPKKTWRLNGVILDSNQLAVLLAAVLSSLVLWIVLRRTRLGLRIRAVVDGRDLAALRGVDPNRTSSMAWMLGSFLAGVAGVLLAPLFTLDPPSFTTIVLLSTPAVVLARFRSLPMALAGGIGIGIIGNLVIGYAGFARSVTGLRTAIPFIILFVLLFFLGPDRSRRAATAAVGTIVSSAGRSSRRSPRRTALVWTVLAAAAVTVVITGTDSHWQSLVARGLALALVMLSFTLVTGLGGMVSLAQATFVTAGAFSAGWALSRGWPFPLALMAGSAVAAVLGVVVSLPARRLGGLALALSTMAAAFIAQNVFFQLDAVGHQSRSGWAVRAPVWGPVNAGDPRVMVALLAVLVGLAVLGVRNLADSPTGRALAALGSSEPAARTAGIRVNHLKTSVFAVSAALAGFGGVLLATTTGSVTNIDFPVEMGFVWLTAVVAFGIRRPLGAVLAGLVVALSPELLRLISPSPLPGAVLFGGAALALARNPDGILGLIATRRRPSTPEDSPRATPPDPLTPTSEHPGGVAVSSRSTGDARDRREGSGPPAPGRSETAAPALQLIGVHAGYHGAAVLHGIDLELPAGTILAVVGPNGAGKSTLCRVVAGLGRVTAGQVLVDGTDVTELAPHRRVDRGTFLIPEGRGVFPSLSVDQNLAMWLAPPDQREEAYRRFPRLADRRTQAAGSLSGGEQQMLALAPALVRPPALLIIDEPSLGLAPLVVEQVFAAIAEINEAGSAVLLVEEKARDVVAAASTVALLETGRVRWVAPTSEVDEERLGRAYLNVTEAPTPSASTSPDRRSAAPAANTTLEGTTQ